MQRLNELVRKHTARPVPAKPLPQQDHHDECDKSVYDGGTCTYNLIEQYGPLSERDDC
ncbi:hypothetical protein ACIQKE_02515 [Streptomyces griseoviridis]